LLISPFISRLRGKVKRWKGRREKENVKCKKSSDLGLGIKEE
jgi:hypothetical protein